MHCLHVKIKTCSTALFNIEFRELSEKWGDKAPAAPDNVALLTSGRAFAVNRSITTKFGKIFELLHPVDDEVFARVFEEQVVTV